MEQASLSRRIEEAYRRVSALEQLASRPAGQLPATDQALGELHILLEELQTAEEELRGQHEFLHAVLESLNHPFYVISACDYTIRIANSAARSQGLDQGTACYEVTHGRAEPCQGPDHVCPLQAVRRTKRPVTLEHIHCTKDGQVRNVELHCHPITDDAGEVTHVIEYALDITERKVAEAERERLLAQTERERRQAVELSDALQQERDLLSAIMEHTEAHLAYFDPQFNFLRVNSTYVQGSGYSQEELIGHNHFDLFPHPENQAIFERARDTGEPAAFRAKPFEFPDRPELGTTYWDWTLVPVKDGEGTVQGLVLSLLDVTGRERARQEREAHLARMDTLIEASREVLAQTSIEGVLQRIVDAACELTGARIGVSGHGYRDGAFQVGATSRAEDVPSCPPGEIFTIERGGVYLDLTSEKASIRLPDGALRAHPAWWGLPEGHAPLRGLLGARLIGRDGEANGLIMVSHKTQGDFTPEDEALLVQLATLTSLALHHIKATEEAEERANEREAILEAMAEGVIVYDAQGIALQANPAAAEMLGFDPMGGDRAGITRRLALRDPDSQPFTADEIPSGRALRGERVVGQRVAFTNARGRDFMALVSAVPIAREGEAPQVVVVFRDITEQELAEQRLRQYARRLQVLNEIDRAVLAATSMEEMAQAATRHIADLVPCRRADVALFDFDREEISFLAAYTPEGTVLGQGWCGPLEWMGPTERLRQGQIHVADRLTALPPSPVKSSLEAEGVRSYVTIPVAAQENLIGSLSLGFASPPDLTAEQIAILSEMADQLAVGIQQARLHQQVQRHAHDLQREVALRTAQLHASEARFRTIFEGAGVGVALLDTEGHILTANPALQEMLGRPAQDLLNVAFTHFTHPDDVPQAQDRLHQLISGQIEGYYRTDMRFLRPDGAIGWANLILSVVEGAQDDRSYVIAMAEDITEWRAAQAALIQTEKLSATGRLAASFAHEINNPLQTVIGCLGLARETATPDSDTARYLAVAHEEVQRAARIVARLRDLNRPVSPEERRPTDVHTLLQTVLDLTRKRCDERDVQVVWQPGEKVPHLLLAPDRMQQVFLNLVLNAVDAMPHGGRLEITSRLDHHPEGVAITIADSGVGIAPDDLSRLFGAFFTTKEEGLGLGLFLTKGIVEDHGGHIDVHSQVGRGTTFTLWLPTTAD